MVNFGTGADFPLGVEEELVLVDPVTHALDHAAVDVLERLKVPTAEGGIHPEAYAAVVELVSPVCANAPDGVAALGVLRRRLHEAGATAIGARIRAEASASRIS